MDSVCSGRVIKQSKVAQCKHRPMSTQLPYRSHSANLQDANKYSGHEFIANAIRQRETVANARQLLKATLAESDSLLKIVIGSRNDTNLC